MSEPLTPEQEDAIDGLLAAEAMKEKGSVSLTKLVHSLGLTMHDLHKQVRLRDLVLSRARYRRALLRVMKEGSCICGSKTGGDDPGYFIEGEGTFHHFKDGCPLMIVAKALRLQIRRVE